MSIQSLYILPTNRRAIILLLVAMMALAAAQIATSQSLIAQECHETEPTAVAVLSVPVVVSSTIDDYFVLYVKHDIDGTEVEIPVQVKLGEAGTTTLSENVEALARRAVSGREVSRCRPGRRGW